jgi:hypothetical protein
MTVWVLLSPPSPLSLIYWLWLLHTNRWTNDEPDGTSFHEIITFPTLTPHLAHAEHLFPYMTQSMVPPLHALTPDVPNATPPQVSSTGTEL